jgi:hypothetical protein
VTLAIRWVFDPLRFSTSAFPRVQWGKAKLSGNRYLQERSGAGVEPTERGAATPHRF